MSDERIQELDEQLERMEQEKKEIRERLVAIMRIQGYSEDEIEEKFRLEDEMRELEKEIERNKNRGLKLFLKILLWIIGIGVFLVLFSVISIYYLIIAIVLIPLIFRFF